MNSGCLGIFEVSVFRLGPPFSGWAGKPGCPQISLWTYLCADWPRGAPLDVPRAGALDVRNLHGAPRPDALYLGGHVLALILVPGAVYWASLRNYFGPAPLFLAGPANGGAREICPGQPYSLMRASGLLMREASTLTCGRSRRTSCRRSRRWSCERSRCSSCRRS